MGGWWCCDYSCLGKKGADYQNRSSESVRTESVLFTAGLHHLEEGLAHSRHSRNTCYRNE